MAEGSVSVSGINYTLAAGVPPFSGATNDVVGLVQLCTVAADHSCNSPSTHTVSVQLRKTSDRNARATASVRIPLGSTPHTPHMALVGRVMRTGPAGAQWCGANTTLIDTDFISAATETPTPLSMECTQCNYVDAIVSSMCPPLDSGMLRLSVSFSKDTQTPPQEACRAWSAAHAESCEVLNSIQSHLYDDFVREANLDRCSSRVYNSMARNQVYELRGMPPEHLVAWQTNARLDRSSLEALGHAACELHGVDPKEYVACCATSSAKDTLLHHGVALTARRLSGAGLVAYETDMDSKGRCSERFSSVINTIRAIGDAGVSNQFSICGDCEDSAIFNACTHASFCDLNRDESENPKSLAAAIASQCHGQKAAIVTCAVHTPNAGGVRNDSAGLMTHTTCVVADESLWTAMISRQAPDPVAAHGGVFLLEGTGLVVTGLDGELAPAPAPTSARYEMMERLQQTPGCDIAGGMGIDSIDFYAYANTLVLDGTLYDICSVDEAGNLTKGVAFSSLLHDNNNVCLRASRNWSQAKADKIALACRRKLVCDSPQLSLPGTTTHRSVYSSGKVDTLETNTFTQFARGSPSAVRDHAAQCGAPLREIPVAIGAKLLMF